MDCSWRIHFGRDLKIYWFLFLNPALLALPSPSFFILEGLEGITGPEMAKYVLRLMRLKFYFYLDFKSDLFYLSDL